MLTVEYISPDGTLIERFEMADGMTLNHAACTICPDDGGKFPVPTIALVGSRPALRKKGDWELPLSAAMIQFRQLAMGSGGNGGGSNPLQILYQVAIIIIAAVTTYLSWGTLGPAWAGALGSMVMLGGSLLGTALFQNKLPQGQVGAMNAEQASPTYSINASGNQARLYQNEPELFGYMLITPDFVANTWTEYVGNDQIGYFVYSIGRGHYVIESMQFGETIFWKDGKLVQDSPYEITALEIVEPGKPVTIFPDNVISSSEVNGQTLFAYNEAEFDGPIGPYVTNPPGTFTNRISLDFVFQQGIGHYNDQGEFEKVEVWWKIEYRKVDDLGNPLGNWQILDWPGVSMATLTPQRITKNYSVVEGRYQVRCVRTNETLGEGKSLDTLTWAAMRATLPGTYTYPITCVAFAVKANNALTQTASRQFKVRATRKLPLYDRKTKTWSEEVPTRSWAAAVSHVCKCEWGGQLTDADFDLDTLWAIDERLQEKGETDENGKKKGWHYDSYIDGPYLVWTLLCEMCQSQLVIPRFVGPILSFVEDGPNKPPVFALTPRNIMRNSFSVNYVTWSDSTPDDVTIEYLDANYGFQQRDVTAVLPESESREPSSLDILGITDRNHAFQVAVAYAAHNRWQRVKVECQVEALGRLINKGDICTVAHPRFRNTCAGIVQEWAENSLLVCVKYDMKFPEEKVDGYYLEIPAQAEYPKTLSQLLEYGLKTDKANVIDVYGEGTLHTSLDEQPKSRFTVRDDDWYIAFTRQDGSIWGPCKIREIDGNRVFLDQADYSTLLVQGQGNPFEFFTAGRDRQATTWTLYSARTYQRLMVVDSVQAQDKLHYTLQLLNYDDRIYSYNDLPVPIWQGRGQLPDNDMLKQPTYLKGRILDTGRIELVWLAVQGAEWYEIQQSSNNTDWQNPQRVTETQITLDVSPGPVYLRVRAGGGAKISAWTSWTGNTLLAAPGVPAPVLSGKYQNGIANISWPTVSGASRYVISLIRNGVNLYTATQTGTAFQVTPEIQTGGPFRSFSFNVSAANENGVSASGSLVLNEPAPAKITAANISITGTTATLTSVTPTLTGISGYVIAMGAIPDFSVNQVQELRQTASLPYSWTGLTSGLHYFRIAAKDSFYDSFHDPYSLNWSDALPVEIV